MNKTLTDFNASVRILHANIDLFYDGLPEAYRVVAVELRKLLCDRNDGKDISLLPRVFVGIKLHQLWSKSFFENLPPALANAKSFSFVPGAIIMNEDGSTAFQIMFQDPVVLIDVASWVEQPFFSPVITIKNLIKSVSDTEAAHSSAEYNATLADARTVSYGPGDPNSHMFGIIAIAEYILNFVQREQPQIRPELLKP